MNERQHLPDESALPPETAMTQLLTQRHLDECARALGRPLYDYEVKILDNILVDQQRANDIAMRKFQITKIHSLDEVVAIFVDRVKNKEACRMVDDILRANYDA